MQPCPLLSPASSTPEPRKKPQFQMVCGRPEKHKKKTQNAITVVFSGGAASVLKVESPLLACPKICQDLYAYTNTGYASDKKTTAIPQGTLSIPRYKYPRPTVGMGFPRMVTRTRTNRLSTRQAFERLHNTITKTFKREFGY
eukprot:1367379-Amphidinium_carterae.2